MTKNNICNIATIVLGVMLLVAGTGHDESLDKAYQFPNLIAIILIVFAVALTIFDWTKTEGGVEALPLGTLAVALAIFLFLACFADVIGFYAISFTSFVVMSIYYSHDSDPWGKRITSSILIAGGFVGVLYLVFALLLQVQAPAGFLF